MKSKRQPAISPSDLASAEQMFQESHVGATVIRNILDSAQLSAVVAHLKQNQPRFHEYRYPLVSRWNLSEADVALNQTMQFCVDWYHSLIRQLQSTVPVFVHCHTKTYSMLYAPGSPGIKPHRDSEDSVNVVAVFTLSGTNDFFVARDHRGNGETQFSLRPGDVTLMRGPVASAHTLDRPMHYVKQVSEPRYVLICRQAREKAW